MLESGIESIIIKIEINKHKTIPILNFNFKSERTIKNKKIKIDNPIAVLSPFMNTVKITKKEITKKLIL